MLNAFVSPIWEIISSSRVLVRMFFRVGDFPPESRYNSPSSKSSK